jgi:prevent-host-death family protein
VEVGVRQLRDELRHWLEVVRNGQEVVVTERGRPVARLIGVSSADPLDRLIREGVITPAQRPRRPDRAHQRVRGRGSVSELVSRQRR